jgi:exopolysaccharide biosynthesis polyprenyl glycosylphosphotransferase
VLVLLLTLPITFLIALAVKLASRGPVFFSQDRVGLNGRVFKMYKFRTMNVGSKEEGDTRWTSVEDPRRTRVGAFLRRTNLDELPQFVNVLRGDMSVVGPRPERPFFVERFLEEVDRYNSRHMFKAGITGWAQVNGWRGDTSIAKRVEYDLYYLRNWSLTFDLQIITMTLVRFFSSKNAY